MAAVQDLNERFASEYGTVPDEPALCLVTGKLLRANQYVRNLNWADGIDMETGRPIESEKLKKKLSKHFHD